MLHSLVRQWMPVLFNDRCWVSECRKLLWSRSCSKSDKVVDRFSRPCDHAATLYSGSASDSVIAGDSGRSSCATEKGTRLGGYGGDERVYGCWRGFFGGIDAFFRAPPVVPELSASFRALEHPHL